MVWCCYKCGMPIYKVVLREKVKYLLNELWGTCDTRGQSCKESMKCDMKRLYIAMTEMYPIHCRMIVKCDVNNMKLDVKWHIWHVIFFVTLHKNIYKISTNFITLYLQLPALQLKKYTCRKWITFPNIKFTFLVLYY